MTSHNKPQTPADFEADSEESGPGINFVAMALRYKWLLATGLFAGLALGQLAYWKMGPSYEAKAQILVSRKNTVPVTERDRALGDFGDRSEHLALILSPMIASEAVKIGHLDKLPTFQGDPDAAATLVEDLKVKRTSGQDRSFLNVLDISYLSPRPADAHAVVAAVISAYSQYLQSTSRENSKEIVALTQKAHDDLLKQLRAKEQEYLQFRQSTPLQWRTPIGANPVDGLTSTNVHQERVVAIEEQRRLNLVKQTEIQAKLKALAQAQANGESQENLEHLVRRLMATEGAQGENRQREVEFNTFDQRLLPLIQEERRLARTYGKDHPELVAIRQNIASTIDLYRQQGLRLPDPTKGETASNQTMNFIDLYRDSLKQQELELKIKEEELSAVFERESEVAKEYASYQSQDQAMNSELLRIRQLWSQLTDRLSQLGIEKDNSGYTLRQIAPIKEELVFKRWLKFIGAGGMFGLGLVAGLCLLRELRDTRLRSADDVRAALGLPVLGNISEFTVDSRQADSTVPFHPAVRYLVAPQSPEAEQYRAARTSLLVTLADHQAKVLQITSPEPGDGKTTLAANLAAAMAQAGKRVLIIDGDLRRPTLHLLTRVPGDIGLSDVLAGEIEFLNAVRPTTMEGLSVLPAGSCPPNPAELLCSPRWERLVHEARNRYDIVLVDGPPVLAVSDPCILAQQVDALLLVVRAGRVSRPMALRARDTLLAQGVPLIGVLVNGLSVEESTTYGYYKEYQQEAPARPVKPSRSGSGDPRELTTVS